MTITTLPARNEFTATAGQTVFNYTFKIFEDTDLNVYITPTGQEADDATDITTAYTVTGAGNSAGGTIILTVGATLNDLVTIVSDVPESRTTDYQVNGDFVPDTVNNDFDRVVSLVKQSNDLVNRSLFFQQSAQNASGLTLPAPEANFFLAWATDLSGLVNATATPGLGDMLSGQNLSDVANVSTSRANLDVPQISKAVSQDSDTGAADLPSGTTAQRPVGVDGMIRYNSTLNVLEGFKDGAWSEIPLNISRGPSSVQTFVAGGTWTKPAGVSTIVVEVVGGGGGGAGGATGEYGSAGGGGGYSKKLIDVTAIASETVTIGAAGAAGATASNGGAGGDSSFGAHATADGGAGGTYSTTSNFGGLGGVAASGDINIQGERGDSSDSTADSVVGGGGGTPLGFGGKSERGSAGTAGTGNGSGGGGGSNNAVAGGAGKVGTIIVWEYK